MKITPIKTNIIDPSHPPTIIEIIDKYVKNITNRSIVAITSKIISICEKNTIQLAKIDKQKLIIQEADRYIPSQKNKYGIPITIKNNILIPSSGIDESNGNNYFILWPKNPQQTANRIHQFLTSKFHINKIGIIITDSTTTPLQWGTTGISIAHSGFLALKNYIDTPDLFGRKLNVTKSNHANSLASAATLVMGEGNESTPIALISDIPFIKFQHRYPTKKELDSLHITIEDDLYSPILTAIKWKK